MLMFRLFFTHIMTNGAYDISRFGRSWCLKKHLDFRIAPFDQIWAKKLFQIVKVKKWVREKISFINFANPLYFLLKIIALGGAFPIISRR